LENHRYDSKSLGFIPHHNISFIRTRVNQYKQSEIAKRFDRKTMGAGFTLIEMIIVVGILAITASIGMAVLDPVTQFQKANDARVKADLSQIQKALEQSYEDNGRYPPINAVNDFRIKNAAGNVIDWGGVWHPYMNIMPKSPYSSSKYVYYSTSDGQAYYLYANLVRGTDQNLCNDGEACQSLGQPDFPISTSCIALCNYGVSSQNVSP